MVSFCLAMCRSQKASGICISSIYILVVANIAGITIIVILSSTIGGDDAQRRKPNSTIEAIEKTNHFVQTSIVQTATATSALATIAKTETPGWLLDQPGVP